VLLREKGGTIRWQPISPPLTTALTDHAACRGAVLPTDALLRYRDGHPCTSRRYDHLWHRIGRASEVFGDEKALWWRRAVDAFPDYADYQRKIDRQIPVFVLEPVSGGTPADDGTEG
jgi:F420H(2)-dependent quinone reductase